MNAASVVGASVATLTTGIASWPEIDATAVGAPGVAQGGSSHVKCNMSESAAVLGSMSVFAILAGRINAHFGRPRFPV